MAEDNNMAREYEDNLVVPVRVQVENNMLEMLDRFRNGGVDDDHPVPRTPPDPQLRAPGAPRDYFKYSHIPAQNIATTTYKRTYKQL